MLRRTARLAFAGAACVAASGVSSAASAGTADYQPPLALYGQFGPAIPLVDAAMVVETPGGLRYIAGQQDSRLTITEVDGQLLFVDTRTRELRELPDVCVRQEVARGVAALCSVPEKFAEGEMYLEVWPRLGDDRVNGKTLPARYRMYVLADAGFDTVRTGAGNDFVNGAQDDDRVWGGAGDDWIRTGIGDDELRGGAGHDELVGVEGDDLIRGGEGKDRVGGGPGTDVLWGDDGQDMVACGSGPDHANVDSYDRFSECETLVRY